MWLIMVDTGLIVNSGYIYIILFGGLEHDFYEFPIILGISSSQLTFTPSYFQRGRYTINQVTYEIIIYG